ncbi:MAG TPA: MmoB/DmpM family protein [Kofleriaceae bacterium]|nr:MmoB/DmpM family protein [Kofleriaceae bacterium]
MRIQSGAADRAARADWVGPVLEVGEVADAIVEAIRERHAPVVVEDRASYVRILTPSPCVLERAAVERRIGRAFEFPRDLELVMPSFKGRLTITGEQAVWSLAGTGSGS